ncbi:MAG: AbrB/MazE/SpoVT family DNA-binding domain-containing protein [Patescibacteria group bacterium]
MIYTVSITSQGQISIPAQLRRKIGLARYRKALVSENNGKLIVEPVKDLLELRGSLKTNIKATPRQIREAFENYLAEEGKGMK